MVLIKKKVKKSDEEIEAERKAKELQKSGIQDEFQAKGFELVSWVQHHKQTIIFGLAGFTAVLVVWGALAFFRSGADVESSVRFEKAKKLYVEAETAKDDKMKKQQEAKNAFDALAKDSGPVARLAQLYRGRLALEMNDAKTAVEAFKTFVDATPSHDPVRVIGQFGLAAAYDSAADPKMALQTYETLLNGDAKIDQPMVLWQAERLAKALGQKEKVAEFEKKRKTFNLSSFAGAIPDLPLQTE